MPREVINPASHKPTADAFHFSAAAKAGGLLILSGQIGAPVDFIPFDRFGGHIFGRAKHGAAHCQQRLVPHAGDPEIS